METKKTGTQKDAQKQNQQKNNVVAILFPCWRSSFSINFALVPFTFLMAKLASLKSSVSLEFNFNRVRFILLFFFPDSEQIKARKRGKKVRGSEGVQKKRRRDKVHLIVVIWYKNGSHIGGKGWYYGGTGKIAEEEMEQERPSKRNPTYNEAAYFGE